MSPRTTWFCYFCLKFILVELSFPTCGRASPAGAEIMPTITATTTVGGTAISSRCPTINRPSDGFSWPKPRELADRKKRNRMQKIMTDNKYMQTWDPDDPTSNLRWWTAVDSLPNSVRTAILNITLPEEITNWDLLLLNTSTIAMFQKELNRLLSDDQVIDIVRGFLQKQQYRQAAQVIERLTNRMTSNPDFFVSLWNDQQINTYRLCNKDVQTFLRQGLRLLPSLETWNATLLRKYGLGFISALPLDILIKIRDSEAGKMILDRWLSDKTFGCKYPVDSDSTDSVISVPHIQIKLMMTALGDISGWSMNDLNRYSSLLNRLSARSLAMIDGQVLIGSLILLSQVKNWKAGQGYSIVNRILFNNSTRLEIMTSERLAYILDRMNCLGPYFLPEYLNTTQSDLLSVWAKKIESFSQRGMELPRLTASALLQYRLSTIANVDVMTVQNLSQQLDASYLKVAPWKLWKLNLAQPDSTTIFNKGLLQRLAVDRSAGSLTDGQIRRLGTVAGRVFRKANKWNIANTPVTYWSGVNLSDYSSLSAKDIQLVVDRVTWAADKMNGGQLAIIYTKLREDQFDLSSKNSIQVIKAMIPVPYLKNRYSSDQLQILAADMPADSIIRLMYATSKLKNYISIEDLSRQPLLVAHLTPSHINSIPLSDIPSLLEAISSSDQGPSIQTIRALQKRLKEYTRSGRVDIAHNDVSLLENVWLANYDIYPATVLVGFSVEAIQTVSSLKKIELLRSLGRLSLIDFYTIPKYKRQAILKEGLRALNKDAKGELDEEDLGIIGNAVVDLNGSSLTRLSARAFENALPILQGDVDIFSGLTARPCLSTDQRSGIRQALKSIYGSPSTWSLGTVMIACCSLDTLSLKELEAIRDDFVLEGCQSCTADFPPAMHLQVLRQNIKIACQFEIGSNELDVGNKVVAQRRAAAAFKTHRDGTIIVRGINHLLGNESSNRLTCEAIVAAGSGAGFRIDQLELLSNDDIRDCLYELGSSPLSLYQATTLWNRILQVYGDASKIPNNQLIQLGWILSGVDMVSLEIIPLNDSDVLAAFGTTDRQLTSEKMEVLSNRVALEWKQGTQFYTGEDLMLLGRLLCGMNASLIDSIPAISYSEASAFLGMILTQPGCSYDTLRALANKAVNVFGPPFVWTPAIVRNVGAVIGGLSPEELRLLPFGSLGGMTPSAVTSIPENNFQAFKTQQLRNFPLAAAQAVTNQRSELVAEMNDALDYVIYGDNLENSSTRNIEGRGLLLVTILLLLLQMNCF